MKKKVVLGTVLEFTSREELIQECIACIEWCELDHDIDDGVPEQWNDEKTWTDEVIHKFLSYQGTAFYDHQVGDYEDMFNDNVRETRIVVEDYAG